MCVCVFYAILDPSSHHASLRLLSLRFPHSSESGVATLSEGTVSWASCWASVERSQLRLHLRRSPLILLIPAYISPPLLHLFVPSPPSSLSVCIALTPLHTTTRALLCHFVILSPCLSACHRLYPPLPFYPSISILKYQQAWICHSRGPLILFCCFEESTWKTITDCPLRAASQTDYSLLNKHTLSREGWLFRRPGGPVWIPDILYVSTTVRSYFLANCSD